MSSSSSPRSPKRSTVLTRAVQTVLARVNFARVKLRENARVPELWIQEDSKNTKANVYPLVGDYYLLGRSATACDIVVKNAVVSKVHLAFSRDSKRPNAAFYVKDRESSNGIYWGKRRVKKLELRNGDVLTLGPPEIADGVRLKYVLPPAWYVRVLRWCAYACGGIFAIAASWVAFEWQKVSVSPLPAVIDGPVTVRSRDGRLLRPEYRSKHGEVARLSDFSPYLPDAVVASEDSRFYWHVGIDPIGILRAIVTNVRGGEIREGASTVTQQLARTLFRDYVGTDDSASRKLREMVVALKLEMTYTKSELLRAYMNRVFLGLDLHGFEDAAQFYFAKPSKDLTLSESATLVGILPAPNSFNPVQDYETAVAYRNRVLTRMRQLGMTDREETDRARRSRLEVNPEAKEVLESTIAPYFYQYVFQELEEILGEQLAREGNFIVQTGLDPEMQAKAEATLRTAVETDGDAYDFSQGSILTLDGKNGEIRAMVGGADYQQSQFNRSVQAVRQPGSTFKIFSYAAALEEGVSPYESFSCNTVEWQGQIYEGCGAGAMNMYDGMATSANAVAMRVARRTGLNKVVRLAGRMGIRSELEIAPGLVLGQSEVTPLEITGAFGVLAGGGTWNRPHAIARVLDSTDCSDPYDLETCREVYAYERDPEKDKPAIDANIATTMTELLQGVVRDGTGTNARLGFGEAGKTGTTDDGVDLWFIGYLPQQGLVTSVWLGNDDNTPTNGSSAQAASVWGQYMERVLEN